MLSSGRNEICCSAAKTIGILRCSSLKPAKPLFGEPYDEKSMTNGLPTTGWIALKRSAQAGHPSTIAVPHLEAGRLDRWATCRRQYQFPALGTHSSQLLL